MSTPNRFLRRIARKPAALRKEILESKPADVLLAVAQHWGIAAKKKADAVSGLLKAAAKIK